MPHALRLPADLTLTGPDGSLVRLADLLGRNRFTAVHLVRYFGCLPCQECLVDLDRVQGAVAKLG